MGPYPLSDNTNLLSSSNYGMSLYRNYGSSYGTNYASCNLYTAKYSNKKSYASTSTAAPAAAASNLNNAYTSNTYQACNRAHCNMATTAAIGSGCASASQTKCNTPVPTRRSAKRERDSFRRHSAHGRMSSTSQGIICNWTHTHTHKDKHARAHTHSQTQQTNTNTKTESTLSTIPPTATTTTRNNKTKNSANQYAHDAKSPQLYWPYTKWKAIAVLFKCDNNPHSHQHLQHLQQIHKYSRVAQKLTPIFDPFESFRFYSMFKPNASTNWYIARTISRNSQSKL